MGRGGEVVLKGECRSVRPRVDDARALRLVRQRGFCSAILRFANEPISIQIGSRKGAERQDEGADENGRNRRCPSDVSAKQRTEMDVTKIRVWLNAGRSAPFEPLMNVSHLDDVPFCQQD